MRGDLYNYIKSCTGVGKYLWLIRKAYWSMRIIYLYVIMDFMFLTRRAKGINQVIFYVLWSRKNSKCLLVHASQIVSLLDNFKLNLFGFWTVSWTKQAISQCHLWLLKHFPTIFCHFTNDELNNQSTNLNKQIDILISMKIIVICSLTDMVLYLLSKIQFTSLTKFLFKRWNIVN